MARGEVLVVLGRKDAEIRGSLGGNLPGCGRFISTLHKYMRLATVIPTYAVTLAL